MTTDLEMLHGNGAENEIDPSYAEFYEGYEDTPESELQVGRQPIERSDFYVLKVTGVDARMQPFEGGLLEANVTFTVEEGPEGMTGRYINGQIALGVGKKRRDEDNPKVLRDATADEIAKAKTSLVGRLKRFQSKLGLLSTFPSTPGVAGVKSWLKPALNKVVIATGYSDDKGYSHVVINSLRLPSDEAVDPKTKKAIPGKTAAEQAVEGRAEEAAKAAKKAGKAPRGKTAGAFAGSSEI